VKTVAERNSAIYAAIDGANKSLRPIATRHRRFYFWRGFFQIVFAAFIPVLALPAHALPYPSPWWSWWSGDWRSFTVVALGLAVTILKGLDGLYQARETWVRQSVTLNALGNERMLFESLSGDYGTAADPTSLFGQNVATLLKGESEEWKQSYAQTGAGEQMEKP
jgi:hypothetical protein